MDRIDRPDGSLARVVLCVDEDQAHMEIVRRMIDGPGVETLSATSAEEALQVVEQRRVDAIVTDVLRGPGNGRDGNGHGLDLLTTLRGAGNSVPVLVLTDEGSVSVAAEALKQGATDFVQKPIDGTRLRGLVAELLRNGPMLARDDARVAPVPEHDRELRPISADGWFEGMLGRSVAMQQVFDAIERVARTEAPVLIVGESGSGKELVARAIHARSARRHGAFVPVHTGAIPKDLVASELFGHERGAFTGALAAADGKFEAATRGSVFLDEVGTMVHDVQIALLRVLETMRFTRVGGRKEHVADVRVIAATNRDLLTLVQEREFREDLYYRLNVFSILLPPLRDRREDIGPLAEHYLHRFAQRYGTPVRRILPNAMERLVGYPWPGNIRELRNVMERAAVFTTSTDLDASALQLGGDRLPEPGHLSREASVRAPTLPVAADASAPTIVIPLGTTVQAAERALIVSTLEYVGGNKQKAARVLGISRRCLYNRLEEYGLLGASKSDPSLEEPVDGRSPVAVVADARPSGASRR